VILKVFDQLFPFENMGLEIKDNCKTIGMYNRALNGKFPQRKTLDFGLK
jgi:hypothetical protein